MNKLTRNLTMLCDFYELTMANGYLKSGIKDKIVYFDVFYRDNPDHGGYAIVAGLEQIVEYIQNLHFEAEDIEYLRARGCFSEEFLEALGSFRFTGEDSGELHYTNAQGDKILPFGIGKNVFCKFPQFGYSDEHAGLPGPEGFLYDCAVSAAWREEQKILLKVQIIDRYFGNMLAIFSFRENYAVIRMTKTAEDFLGEYEGMFNAWLEA